MSHVCVQAGKSVSELVAGTAMEAAMEAAAETWRAWRRKRALLLLCAALPPSRPSRTAERALVTQDVVKEILAFV